MTTYVIATGDFVRTGGMDAANHALAHFLAREGHQVHLVGFRFEDDLASRKGIILHRVPKPLNAHTFGAPLLAAATRRISRKVRAAPNHVIVNGGNAPLRAVNWVHYVHAAYASRAAGGPLARARRQVTRRIDLAAERLALSVATRIVANSERTREDVIEHFGVPPERVVRVYLGTDASRFYPATDAERIRARAELGWEGTRKVALFVGALGDERKGLDGLLSAWELLSRRPEWDVDLRVVGTGANARAWSSRLAKMQPHVAALGFREDIPRILAACDVLVSPAHYEPYGLNVHEALCAGVPAIVSASAGVAERYPAALRDLLLPDPRDVAGLARALLNWRARSAAELRAEVGRLGTHLRARSWGDMSADIADLCG